MILSLQQLAFVIHRQIYQLFFFGFSTLFHIWFREGEDSCRISIIFWRKKKIGVSVSPAFKKPETFLPRDVPFYRLFSGEICRIIPVVIVRCEWRCSDTVLPIPAAVFLLFKSLNWKFTRPSPSNRVKEKFICSPLERDIFLFPSRPRWRSMAVPWQFHGSSMAGWNETQSVAAAVAIVKVLLYHCPALNFQLGEWPISLHWCGSIMGPTFLLAHKQRAMANLWEINRFHIYIFVCILSSSFFLLFLFQIANWQGLVQSPTYG